MALNDILFVKGQGGLGRPLPGQDFISGLVLYGNTLPSGLTATNRIKKMFSVADADSIGIKLDYSDETQATSTITVTYIGNNGDQVTLSYQEPINKITLGAYTKVSTDTTTQNVATSIAAAINSNTPTTGYGATVNGAVITVTVRKGLGISANTGSPVSSVITGGLNAPASLAATGSTTGGTLVAATYYYKVTALNASGETVGSNEVSVTTTGTTSSVALSWAAVAGATSYKIYRGTAAGAESVFYTSTTNSYSDTNAASAAGTVPTVNTTIITATIAQPTGGVASQRAQWRYHINEFFRIQPQGVLFVGVFAVPSGAPTYSEIATMQNFSSGTIRQIAVYKDFAAYNISDVSAIHTQCITLDGQHKNISALLGADISAVSDVSTLSDLSVQTSNKCSVVISQDGAALGATLFAAYGKSVTTLGATLGAIAFAKVNESIGWVGKFNISNGTECDTLAFANGTQFSSATVTDNYLSSVNQLRYIFLRKYVGVAGSFFNDSHTAITWSSDYAYIEGNRTIDKAIRGIYTNTISDLSSPLTLKSDGTLADITIAYLISDARKAVDQMQRDGEISAYGISIDPTQNVASTSKVVIAVKDIPVGVARNIEVDIMNAKSL